MNGSLFKRHAAAVVLELVPGGVLKVTISGPLTGDTLIDIKRQVIDLAMPAGPRAFLVDYRKAVLALDGAALDAVLEGEQDGALPTKPAAMLATPAQVDVLRGHAARMALMGHFRRVFTDSADGLRWAQAMAAR